MTLWTPDGERPVAKANPASEPVAAPVEDLGAELSDEQRAQASEMAREMAEVQAEIAKAPASVVIANHLMGIYEVAAIHLSQTPPNFGEATVAIDALAAVLDKLKGRLGENEPVLKDAQSQLQLAFVELKRRADAPDQA